MEETIKFGIGFVTGRPNVCKIINNTYKQMLEQVNCSDKKVELTIFILFDLGYQYTTRVDFYGIIPEVYKDINIRYITPEDIEEEKKRLIAKEKITRPEADLFFGHGHAKGRNTLMYFAKKMGMNHLLFWDDDEYPVACIKEENGEITWKKQNNLLMHIKYLKDADVTIGYHCGYISPIPYVELEKDISEKLFQDYVEAISNEVVSWKAIKEKMVKDNGITYADKDIANEKGAYEIQKEGIAKWVVGSTLCLNLDHIDKIPAFYNPPEARGEDTFFSVLLNDAKVMKIPLYHFHDGFLKYTNILRGKYPKTLRKIKVSEDEIGQRFLKASKGLIKYKPLLSYLSNEETYKQDLENDYRKLEESIPEVNKLFDDCNFMSLLDDMKEYTKNIDNHYRDFIKTNEIWNRIKEEI